MTEHSRRSGIWKSSQRPPMRLATTAMMLVVISSAMPGTAEAGVVLSGALQRPSDASRFGWAVSVDDGGTTLVVGAPGIGNGDAPGRAYVYGRIGPSFALLATLRASDEAGPNGFGSGVAVAGNTIIVGAGSVDKAYVFLRPSSGWSGSLTEAARLTPSTSSPRFGDAVALDNNVAVVGDNDAVFVYPMPPGGWFGTRTESAKLMAVAGGRVGGSVAIDEDVIVSGHPDPSTHNDVGVYVRSGGTWTGSISPVATLSPPQDPRGFGELDISGDVIVVGASQESIGENLAQGAAYIFERPSTGWSGALSPSARLIASNGGQFDSFGWAVAIDGTQVVVGNRSDLADGSPNDGAYVFDKPTDGWSGTILEAQLLPSGSSAGLFGSAVELDGGTIVVGDQADGSPGSNYGVPRLSTSETVTPIASRMSLTIALRAPTWTRLISTATGRGTPAMRTMTGMR